MAPYAWAAPGIWSWRATWGPGHRGQGKSLWVDKCLPEGTLPKPTFRLGQLGRAKGKGTGAVAPAPSSVALARMSYCLYVKNLVSCRSATLTLRLYNQSPFLAVPSHLCCNSNIHVRIFQIFTFNVIYPCFGCLPRFILALTLQPSARWQPNDVHCVHMSISSQSSYFEVYHLLFLCVKSRGVPAERSAASRMCAAHILLAAFLCWNRL